MAATGLDKEQAQVEENLRRIRHRLLVFSGKGGVGKSTVAVNIAAGLAQAGWKVGVLDVDIHGPDVAKMLGVEDRRMDVSAEGRITPVETPSGIRLVSMAFLLQDRDTPVVWRGPLKMKIIKQFLADVDWEDMDWLIFDSPPGTGDEPLTIAQLVPATAAVVVTTPQGVAVLDTRKAVKFAQMLKLNVRGVVENMSGLNCPHCGKHIELFKAGGGEAMARELLVPLLAKVPIDPAVVDSGDSGTPFVVGQPGSEASQAVRMIVEKLVEMEGE
jgi:ATP-binding protein involved in chromosome partitioning